jgi:xylulokinase
MDLIAIIDLGTGSIRLTVYDMSGGTLYTGKRDNPLIQPRPGWVEQDPVYWWDAVKDLFTGLPQGISRQISAISVTSQREGVVPVNEGLEPLGNCIIWLDGRTVEEGREVEKRLGREKIYGVTGLVPNPVWSLSKILWIRKHRPEIYGNACKFLQAEDFILSVLCGRAVSEFSIASRTCMLDVANRRWSEFILEEFGIDRDKLPELYEPGTLLGKIDPVAARSIGVSEEVEIHAGAGDQQAAALGVGALEEGIVSIGIGTSSALSMTLEKPVYEKKGNIILNCAALPGKWEYEPPIWNTGGLIKWFHEQILDSRHTYDDIISGADRVPAGSDGLITLPYFSGAGSPRWNPGLKGTFFGLTLGHDKNHMLRSIMESIAFEIRYNLDTIEESGIRYKKVILSGGASQNMLLCRIIADVLQSGIEVSYETEASSRGAFLLVMDQRTGKKGPSGTTSPQQQENLVIQPDPANKDSYERSYHNYIELGNRLESLSFLK